MAKYRSYIVIYEMIFRASDTIKATSHLSAYKKAARQIATLRDYPTLLPTFKKAETRVMYVEPVGKDK